MAFQSPNYTQAPNDLFDDLLKQIDELSELKVTLAAIRQTFGYHRTQAEMSLSWFETVTGLARNSVRRGVEKSIERGTLAKVKEETARDGAIYEMVVEGQPLTPRGSAVAPLEGQPLTPLKKERKNKETTPAAMENAMEPIPNVFQVWESIGLSLNPFLKEELLDLEKEYGATWLIEAIKRAAMANKRSLSYIKGILRRWHAAGAMDSPAPVPANKPAPVEKPTVQWVQT